MACKIIYKGKALPEEEAKIEINNDVVDDLNEQAVGKSIINSALLTDEEINQQITDLNKFKTVIENNYFKLEDNISVSSLVINKHIKNAPASLGKVKIDSKWRTKEEAKKQVEENLKQRKLFSKLKRNFGITEEQLNLIENVSADKAISSAEDLINAIESKLLSLNSLVLNSKKSKSATLQQKEQAKPIEQLFNENPELANSVYEALGFNNLRKEYSNVIIDQVWKRLASEGITNADSLIGTRETINNKDFNKFWSAVKDVDIQNEISFFESEKQKALDSYSKYKGEFDPTTGTFTSNDTSFFDNKIKDLKALLQQKQQALEVYSQYLEQNPNGNVEQFKSWVDEFSNKMSLREFKPSTSSLPLKKGKTVEYKKASDFATSIKKLSERFEIEVYLKKLNDEGQLNVFGNTGPLGNYDAIGNKINLNVEEDIYEGVIVHEFIHAFSKLMQTYNKSAFRTLVDKHYESLKDLDTVRALWKIALDYGNLETIPLSLKDLPEGLSKDLIYDEIFTRLIEREYNENGSIEDFKKPSNIFYQIFEWVKNFLGVKYNRKKEFSKLTTSSSVKDFYNLLKKVDSLRVSKEEYLKASPFAHESLYNVREILDGKDYNDLSVEKQSIVREEMLKYNEYMKTLPKMKLNNSFQQFQQSLNKPNTNPILQGNQQEQVKKFAELQERLNNKEFLEGAKSAFESSEELQNVYYEASGVGQNIKTKKTGLLDYFLNVKKDSVFQELIQIAENLGIGIEEYESDSPLQANWNGKNVTINKTYGKVTSNVIAHEVVHGILHILTNNDYANSKLNLKLEKFKIELFNYIEKKGINNLNLPPELRILNLDYIKKMSNQEIVTYAFTDSQFSEFLASIKTDAKISSRESFWNKLIHIFNTTLKELGFTSKLDELIDILNTEVPLFNNVQITPQQKQDALNAYTDFIARVSLGIVKNPTSGEYNYTSKVKDIVYHGTNAKFDKFDKSKLGTKTINKTNQLGFYFSDKKVAAMFNSLLPKDYYNKPEEDLIKLYNKYLELYGKDKAKEILDELVTRSYDRSKMFDRIYLPDSNFISAVINSKNPLIADTNEFAGGTRGDGTEIANKYKNKSKNNDSIILPALEDGGLGGEEFESENYVVFEPEQIHILGSQSDIQGFKDFVQGKQDFDKELAQKIQDKLQKLYPEIKLNITNVPVWEQGDNVFNQELEEQINNFVLFENQDKLCPSGICNYTAKASTEHLQKIGLNPYPSNYNGSQLPVKVKSPIGYFNIEHYVSAVAINNAIYIYDMPQNEFISNEFFGKGSDVKIKESYKPRLIPLTIDEIKSNYNLSTQEAGNFIHSIINNNGWKGADAAPSFRKYIENNIKNSQEYINLLEAQIKDFDYEFEQWDVEEYRREIKDKRDALKTKKVTKEEEQKVIKYYENKLKLKTKEYLPKRADKFSLKTLVDSVIGRGFDSSIDFSSFETALESLDKYLKSEIFIEDLLNKVTIAKENLDSKNESINKVYSLAKLFASFTKQVKVYGIEEAVKKYDSKQQYTIRTLLPSNVLDKYKSKEQAALLLQKYWGNKDNIVKQLNIFKNTTFTDLITNRFKAHSVFNKYQTVLNFLKSTDFDSSYLYQVISNEAIRKYTYFDKIGNTQFQKDEFNRIIGQANVKAMTVLVDAIKQKQDTLPHEYAHHYIAWFRDTPIVQEAIKKWGSEEALVQSIGEQVVKQKGEAYNWWNKFVKWIMNQFNSLSKLQKEELTQILTDAFLTRQDLNNINNQQFQKLTAEEKAKTIEQPNTLFGLNIQNQEQLEFHVNTLNVVSKFLENVGVEQRLVPEFLSQDGSIIEGALAAANFLQGTVDIIEDINKRPAAWNKLPEEAAHWWYRLLNENSPLKKALWESHQTALKNNELYAGEYGKLKGINKPEDLTEESIGQLIAEAIKRIETKNGNASDYSFFKKFLEWINSIIDIFETTTQDPFEVAAMKILSSDMSDLMTWEEYRKINNIVNFADVLTEQSVAPIDYTLIDDIGQVNSFDYGIPVFRFDSNDGTKDSPEFRTQEELDNWVSANIKEHDQRQKQILQEVRDNQIFFDRLLNKTFRKKSKFLPKTLRKYFDIIDAQNLTHLREWNISQELQKITKKLTPEEKRQIVETNGYTNIAPTLKVLPDLLQKYRKNPIVLSEPIKIDGAKKQELSILNGIREMIKLENPNLKSITAEEFVAEAHNWLQTNYLLGFANEKSYLSYRTDQTFSYLSDRQSNEDVDITNMTEEELQRLPFEERQRIANIVGLTKQNPDVYHNKVSLRFNDMYHLKSGHFDKSPSAWGNLTYFYTGKNKWKDAVLLHEIQNDNIESLREFKAEKVDLETSLGRYLQKLNTGLLDNITQIESGGKKIIRNDIWSTNPPKQHLHLNSLLIQLKDLPLEQGLSRLKESLSELIELYKSDNSKNPEKAQEDVEKAYSQRRIFQNFQKRGGIKSLLTKEELQELENIIKDLNNTTPEETVVPDFDEDGHATMIREGGLKQKKQNFLYRTENLNRKLTKELHNLYGANAPIITLTAPAKPLPKSQRQNRVVNRGTPREMRIENASQELNENVNFLIVFSEQQIIKQLSKNIEKSKKNYIQARNATTAYNFNVQLSKITLEQWGNLVENYKYNEDLLNRLIDEQAQKDIRSPELEKITKAKSIIRYLGDDPSVKLGKGKYGFIWDTANTDKGIVAVWDAYKNAYTSEDSYVDNWTVDEFLEYVKKVAPEYLTLDTKNLDINTQKSKFETLKQKALDKKAELEKNYGKIEEEVKQTLEIEMNYFTPLVHHLIQKHINQYGKDFPMYFSGYEITKLTQGNDRTAWIYAGKDEINIVDKTEFTINGITFYKYKDGSITKRENGKVVKGTLQEYEKAYQQATERRAKEIKVQAAQELGLFPTVSVEKLSNEKLNEGIKALNEFKKIPKSDPRSRYNYKSNANVVIEKLLEINNNKPIETGAIYNAMSQVSGVKLIWQDKIEGLQGNVGGYLVDLTNYNYNTPILYGLNTSKVVPINPNMVDDSEIQYSKTNNNTEQQTPEDLLTKMIDSGAIQKDCTGGFKAKDGIRGKFTKGSQ